MAPSLPSPPFPPPLLPLPPGPAAPQVLEGHTEWVTSVAFSPDGTTLASGSGGLFSDNNTVRLWAAATGELRQVCGGGGLGGPTQHGVAGIYLGRRIGGGRW